jgi:hypothetical protein
MPKGEPALIIERENGPEINIYLSPIVLGALRPM